ncbi:basic proline-rich protein-like [Melospiza georgiana]|uniref:basic proline-rich protein-like n=1 Tax=Melospiza georgiana TaxID=44398 RepID=UPI0025ABCC61|nr:basic proline-rich protein-like [Melospiza georgiana]
MGLCPPSPAQSLGINTPPPLLPTGIPPHGDPRRCHLHGVNPHSCSGQDRIPHAGASLPRAGSARGAALSPRSGPPVPPLWGRVPLQHRPGHRSLGRPRAAAPTGDPAGLQQPRLGRTHPGIPTPARHPHPSPASPARHRPPLHARCRGCPARRGAAAASGVPGDIPPPCAVPGPAAALSPRSPCPWQPAAWAGGGRERGDAAERGVRDEAPARVCVSRPAPAAAECTTKTTIAPRPPHATGDGDVSSVSETGRFNPLRAGRAAERCGLAGRGVGHPSAPQHPTPTPARGPSRLIDSARSQWPSSAAGGAGGSRLQEGRERRGQSRRLDRTAAPPVPVPAPPSAPARPQHR